jgi:hypothetical protein
MVRVGLNELAGQPEAVDSLTKLTAQFVIADAADDHSRVAELVAMEGEVERGTAGPRAVREEVPEEFAKRDDRGAARQDKCPK